jgi:hypothetical protein
LNDKSKRPPPAQVATLSANQIRRTSAHITPLARAHRRRLLRRLDITYGELDPIARGHFDIYARTIAKIEVADAWFEENGYIHDKGAMPAVAQVYTSLLNTAGRALERLQGHLEQRPEADPFAKYRTLDAVESNGD